MEINSNRNVGPSVNINTKFRIFDQSAEFITSHLPHSSIVHETPIHMNNNSTAPTSILRPHAQFQRHPLIANISPNISQQELNHQQQILINELLNEKYLAAQEKEIAILKERNMQLEKAEKKRKEQERQRSISRRIVHNASTNQLEKILNAKKRPFSWIFVDWEQVFSIN
jgi:hypothetical protein